MDSTSGARDGEAMQVSPSDNVLSCTESISAEANKHNSPLLRLPTELRNVIYAFACEEVTIIELDISGDFAVEKSALPLLLLCEQTNEEVQSFANAPPSVVSMFKYFNLWHSKFPIGLDSLDPSTAHTLRFSAVKGLEIQAVKWFIKDYIAEASDWWREPVDRFTSRFAGVTRIEVEQDQEEEQIIEDEEKHQLRNVLQAIFGRDGLEVVYC